MQIGSKHRLKMLLGTLSAPKRGQMGSKALNAVRGTPTFGTFWAENVAPRPHYGSDLGSSMAPQNAFFESRLALGSSTNEVLEVVFENVRNIMNFRCEKC